MTDLASLWRSIEAEGSGYGHGLVSRRSTDGTGLGSHLAFDAGRRTRWLIVELGFKPESMAWAPNWKEIRIHAMRDTPGFRAGIGIELISADFKDVFDALVGDLVGTLQMTADGPARLLETRSRIQKWNRFLKEFGPRGLSERQVRGLIGELAFLERHVLHRSGALEAVQSWHGPNADAKDFHGRNRAVEVKSVGESEDGLVRINSEQQLMKGPFDHLTLYVLQLDDAPHDGESLVDMVQRLRAVFSDDPAAAALFSEKLVQAGFLDSAVDRYTRDYSIQKESFFEVTGDFPRIVRPPPGVSKVQYSLALASLNPYQRDAPTAMAGFVPGAE